MIDIIKTTYTTAALKYPSHTKLVFYIFSGGMGAVTNIGLLFILTHFFGLYYVVSGIISFIASVFVSFYLQKKLTFRDNSGVDTKKKFATFTGIAIINLVINTGILILLVEKAGLHYLLAQFIGSAIIAVWSFFAYKFLVFKV